MAEERGVVTAAGFRVDAAATVEWVARYLEGLGTYPVSPDVAPGDIVARLPAHPPESPEDFSTILADLDRVVLPGITHWQAPGFFAYFPASSSPPGGSRRAGVGGISSERNALDDLPGMHRARDGGARLAGRAARPA